MASDDAVLGWGGTSRCAEGSANLNDFELARKIVALHTITGRSSPSSTLQMSRHPCPETDTTDYRRKFEMHIMVGISATVRMK